LLIFIIRYIIRKKIDPNIVKYCNKVYNQQITKIIQYLFRKNIYCLLVGISETIRTQQYKLNRMINVFVNFLFHVHLSAVPYFKVSLIIINVHIISLVKFVNNTFIFTNTFPPKGGVCYYGRRPLIKVATQTFNKSYSNPASGGKRMGTLTRFWVELFFCFFLTLLMAVKKKRLTITFWDIINIFKLFNILLLISKTKYTVLQELILSWNFIKGYLQRRDVDYSLYSFLHKPIGFNLHKFYKHKIFFTRDLVSFRRPFQIYCNLYNLCCKTLFTGLPRTSGSTYNKDLIYDNHNNIISLKFKEWFAGLTDGYGYIYVNKKGCVGFELNLPSEDVKVARILQNKFGGRVHARSGYKAVRYRTHNKDTVCKIVQCLNGLVVNNIRLAQLHKVGLALNICIKKPILPSINSAYISGLFDSEGAIDIVKRVCNISFRYQLTISFSNKSRNNLEFLLNVIGGNIFFDTAKNGQFV